MTHILAARARAVRYEQLSSEARQLVRQCMLDHVAVTLAGANEQMAAWCFAEMEEQGGAPNTTVFLHGGGLPVLSAALVNGAASHALDYDDVNLAMPGHPTVAIMPALLALAEETHASGGDLIAAFVAGYELQCRAGLLVAPAHYDHGFHATGTIGAFGAVAAHRPALSPRHPRAAQRASLGQSRPRKSGQDDKWSFCLTAGTLCPANQERP